MDKKISELNVAIDLTDSDVLPIVNGGETKKVTIAQIKAQIGSGVPYVGATQDLNLGEFGLQTGNIEFDLTPTNVPTNVGSMLWNDTAGTLDLKLKGGNVTLQIGQETVIRVVNKTATNITLLEGNYQAVRVTGAQGQRPKVDLALANSDLNSATTLGLVTETILNNQEGFVNTSGEVNSINTTGSLQGETWIDGDLLYLSGIVAGQITNIKPIAPIHTVIIGFVEYTHAINGKIFVKVNNGYELEELHNVSAISPNNNEGLFYDTPTLLWKPKTVIDALGYTPENVANKSISITLGTSDTLYPTQNAVKTYVDSIVVGGDFANVVYVNAISPSTATIFDLNNPPVTNDNALKADTGNIYIGNDNSNWIYKTSPVGYYTYTSTARSSNFYLAGTTTDAGNSKTAAIQRAGSIKAPKFITIGGNSSNFVKGDGSLDLNTYQIALTNPIIGTGTTNYLPKFTGTSTLGNSSIQNLGGRIIIGSIVDNGVDTLQVNGSILSKSSNPLFVMRYSDLDTNALYLGASFGYNSGIISYGTFAINRNPTDGVFFNTGRAAAQINLESKVSNAEIAFYTSASNNTVPTQIMRITGTGNLLLQNGGTFTDAGYRLDVNGTTRLSSTYGATLQVTGASLQSGNIFKSQPTPIAKTGGGAITLTIAELLTLIITASGTIAYTFSLPTGTLTDAGILSGLLPVQNGFDWNIINNGTSTAAILLSASTGHTIVGLSTVSVLSQATFRTVKTATNTFVTYRVN